MNNWRLRCATNSKRLKSNKFTKCCARCRHLTCNSLWSANIMMRLALVERLRCHRPKTIGYRFIATKTTRCKPISTDTWIKCIEQMKRSYPKLTAQSSRRWKTKDGSSCWAHHTTANWLRWSVARIETHAARIKSRSLLRTESDDSFTPFT